MICSREVGLYHQPDQPAIVFSSYFSEWKDPPTPHRAPPGPTVQVDKRRRVALPALPERPKRDAQDLVSCDAMKRRRIWTGGGQVPVLKVPEKQELLGF